MGPKIVKIRGSEAWQAQASRDFCRDFQIKQEKLRELKK
jgi:hypothetical protein